MKRTNIGKLEWAMSKEQRMRKEKRGREKNRYWI